ncbi:hypothetical protein NQ318_022012 [Aromia moschata]|uniref:Cytochrome P450 n=1 Tax=Aromia moschata TaxID=1265417 RepID=A0AAV8Z5X9_9CUCU|nr:hypothetical protein NQ318_022012 [Aromia moschata]
MSFDKAIYISIALLTVLAIFFKWWFSYWKRKGLECPETSIPFGNTKDLFLGRSCFGETWKDIYFQLKSKGLRHGGVYFSLKRVYMPVDLQLVKNILQNDFQHFHGHGLYVNEEVDPLSANLFNLDGPKWKTLRSKLTPTFTSGKLKMMFQTLVDCSGGLKEILEEHRRGNIPVDVKDVMGRFTTDIIGSCAFGIECNSMKNPQSDFRKYGIKAIHPDVIWTLKMMIQLLFPHSLLRSLNFIASNPQVTSFFHGLVSDTIKCREDNNVVRKDFMHLLIQLKNKGDIGDDGNVADSGESGFLTLNEVVAQSLMFFVGGFETSSTTLNFAAYELALHPDVQEKLRKEINEVLEKHENQLTYDTIMEMTYMDQVIYETLRKHPPLQQLFRICSKAYRVPGTDVVIDEGTMVMVPIWGIHCDPEYYPDPEKFDPERFNEENKSKRPQFAWLPFGEGPRICIGLRFGMMQTKIGLITLLKQFKIGLNDGTKYPMVYSKSGIIAAPEGTILIDLHEIP